MDPNQVFLETVGGRKKGKVAGLGMGADLYYERPARRGGSSSSSTCAPSILSQLSSRLEDSERAREELERERVGLERERLQVERERLQMQKEREEERLAVQREREDERRRHEEYLAEMKRTLESYGQMLSQCSGSFRSSQPHDPQDPSGGGGASCAT